MNLVNSFSALDSFDDLIIPVSTRNKERKLKKKLRQIEKLSQKKPCFLSLNEKEKLKNKKKIEKELDNLLNPKVYIKPKKKKRKKSNAQIDRENIIYRQKLIREKEERYRNYEEFWSKQYNNYQKWNKEYNKNKKSYYTSYNNRLYNFGNGIKDACLFMQLDINNLDLDKVKKAYHKLAREYHPDKGGNHEKMLELSKNYGILKAYLKK
jgi:hypothetical protein